jgi:hypothetical protein
MATKLHGGTVASVQAGLHIVFITSSHSPNFRPFFILPSSGFLVLLLHGLVVILLTYLCPSSTYLYPSSIQYFYYGLKPFLHLHAGLPGLTQALPVEHNLQRHPYAPSRSQTCGQPTYVPPRQVTLTQALPHNLLRHPTPNSFTYLFSII